MRDAKAHEERMRRLLWQALLPLLFPLGAVIVLALVALFVR